MCLRPHINTFRRLKVPEGLFSIIFVLYEIYMNFSANTGTVCMTDVCIWAFALSFLTGWQRVKLCWKNTMSHVSAHQLRFSNLWMETWWRLCGCLLMLPGHRLPNLIKTHPLGPDEADYHSWVFRHASSMAPLVATSVSGSLLSRLKFRRIHRDKKGTRAKMICSLWWCAQVFQHWAFVRVKMDEDVRRMHMKSNQNSRWIIGWTGFKIPWIIEPKVGAATASVQNTSIVRGNVTNSVLHLGQKAQLC